MKKKILLVFYAMSLLMLQSTQLFAQEESLIVKGTSRSMIVYSPNDLGAGRPLMISLHGMDQDPAFQMNQSKWEQVADTAKFVVVYPHGVNNRWDISGNSDIDFILAIIDEMYARYEIDKNRVYLSGFSMGGMMTYYSATKIADKIAAFAPVSGYLMGGPNTNSSRPIPIIHTHGTADNVVVYSGVKTCLDAWITRNHCPVTPVLSDPYPATNPNSLASKSYWGPGLNGVEVVLMTIRDKGHWWSLDTQGGVHTSAEIWKFCRKYSIDPSRPSIRFLSPAQNSEWIADEPISFEVSVSDPEGSIKDVCFYEGDNLLTKLTEAPYQYTMNQPVVGEHVLRAKVTDSQDKSDEVVMSFKVVPPKAPILIGTQPERYSFELPLTTSSFRFEYDEPVDCSRIKAQLSGNGESVDLILTETGFSAALNFDIPESFDLHDGEYQVSLTDVFNVKNISSSRADIVKYAFGVLGSATQDNQVFSDHWNLENGIPEGWKLTYNTTVREQLTTYSSGPRVLKFLSGGEFEYGMYLRDEGGVSRFSYGTYEQNRLNLLPGIYSVSFYYSWWTAGTAERNRKIHFSVLDLSGNIIYEQRDIATQHGFNENRNVVVAGSQKCEISFSIDEAQPYVLQWRTEQFGFDGAIVGGIQMMAYSTVADIAKKYKDLFEKTLLEANVLMQSVEASKYDGVQKNNLISAIEGVSNVVLNSPSLYQNVVNDLESVIADMTIYKSQVDIQQGSSIDINGIHREIINVEYYSLNGEQLNKPVNGICLMKIVFNDGHVEVRRIVSTY
ncbi:MAG: hypothetical protein JXR39_13175 [Marinilabiliaceae bacterium]|nr:hypothetical protein [Marinilabiliaceae bacterium]